MIVPRVSLEVQSREAHLSCGSAPVRKIRVFLWENTKLACKDAASVSSLQAQRLRFERKVV